MRFRMYRLFIILSLLLWTPLSLLAQHTQIEKDYEAGRLSLDQKVLYQFYAQQSPRQLPAVYAGPESTPIKCVTPAIMELHRNEDQLSPATLRQAKSMLKAGALSSSQTQSSASGKSIIHYQTAGEHAVPAADSENNGITDYVEPVTDAESSSYRHEVLRSGYTDPYSSVRP